MWILPDQYPPLWGPMENSRYKNCNGSGSVTISRLLTWRCNKACLGERLTLHYWSHSLSSKQIPEGKCLSLTMMEDEGQQKELEIIKQEEDKTEYWKKPTSKRKHIHKNNEQQYSHTKRIRTNIHLAYLFISQSQMMISFCITTSFGTCKYGKNTQLFKINSPHFHLPC